MAKITSQSVMGAFAKGKLHSGRGGKIVSSKLQAARIAEHAPTGAEPPRAEREAATKTDRRKGLHIAAKVQVKKGGKR